MTRSGAMLVLCAALSACGPDRTDFASWWESNYDYTASAQPADATALAEAPKYKRKSLMSAW